MATVLVLGSFAESLVNFRGPLISALVDRGHRVLAAAPGASADLRAAVHRLGARFVPVPLDRTGMHPLRDLRTLLNLAVLLRRHRVEVLLGYTVKPVLYGSLAARLAGVPRAYSMITGIGNTFPLLAGRNRWLGRALRALYRTALRGNAAIFFQNRDDESQFRTWRLLGRDARVVRINGSGVDLARFRPAPLPDGAAFLLLGRLLGDKGIREYATAARLVRTLYPDVACRLAGWHEPGANAIDPAQLACWTRRGDLDYLGPLTDVRPAIAACAVYVLPSYREGLPRSVLEAMAMGRPVITTDVPGCRETVVDGRNGFLVPPRDPRALARAMLRFVRHPGLIPRMGRAGRRMAAERFDVRRVNRDLIRTMGL